MGLEAATFIDDLTVTNPVNTDTKSQGDDHLRLIKTVLKNSIKRVSRAFYVPNTVAKSANYTVLAADDNKTIVCDTTSAFTLTLPVLTADDAGWCIYVLKTTTDANPVFIAPPSGTINGHTKVRRSVLGLITKVLWTGSVFVASRNGPSIGSLEEFYGTTLPQGRLWPDGATFTAADYVELNTVLGGNTKPDKRGKLAAGKTNMGVGDAGGITTAGSGIDGLTLKATGGAQFITMTRANLPQVSVSITITDPGHLHGLSDQIGDQAVDSGAINNIASFNRASSGTGEVTNAAFTGISGSFHLNGNVTQTNMIVMPPTIIANFVLVAE